MFLYSILQLFSPGFINGFIYVSLDEVLFEPECCHIVFAINHNLAIYYIHN